MGIKLEVGVDNNPIQYNNPMDYELGHELAQTKSLIYKNEFILNLRYKLKIYNRGFYLNGLNGLE